MEYKIVLIGEAEVGKSSLVKKLITNNFYELYTPTLGVEVYPITIETNIGQIKFIVWDCAGKPEFMGLSDGYYLGMNGAIVMASSNIESLETININKQKISNINNQTPIVTVISKCDLLNENNQNFLIIEEYVNIHDNVITISTKNDELNDLFEIFLLLAKKVTNNENLVLV